MCPIPQYPLYSALTTLIDGELVGYFLDESKVGSPPRTAHAHLPGPGPGPAHARVRPTVLAPAPPRVATSRADPARRLRH